jgi:hypothetical protein
MSETGSATRTTMLGKAPLATGLGVADIRDAVTQKPNGGGWLKSLALGLSID